MKFKKPKQIEEHFLNEILYPGRYSSKQAEMILNGEWSVAYLNKEEIIKKYNHLLTDKEKKELGL